MQPAKRNSPSNAEIVGVHIMDVFSEHESSPPGASVVLGMREHMPDVHYLPVVMDGSDEPKLIPSDIKDRVPAHLIGGRECDPQTGKGPIGGLSNDRQPVHQRGSRIRMNPREFDQPPSRDDMHAGMISQIEIVIKRTEKPVRGLSVADSGTARERVSRRTWKELMSTSCMNSSAQNV
jgi:hypothetical protein